MNNNSVQTSVNIDKNAWIICDSRSHPGLKFYVNKVTGIKVWNITESEIALAEKVDKIGSEPEGSPTMNNATDQTAIYNKQVINNQFSNQLPNRGLTASAGSPYHLWDNKQSQPVNLQQQLFNSQGQPVNLQQQLFNSQGQPVNSQQQLFNSQDQTVNLQQQLFNYQDQPVNLQQQLFNSQDQTVNLQQQLFNSQDQPVNLQQQLFNSQDQTVNLQQQLFNSQGQPVNLQQLFNSQGQPVNFQQQLFTLVPTAALTPLLNQAASYQLLAQSTNLHNNTPIIPKEEYCQNQQTPTQRSFNLVNYGNNDRNEENYHRQESTLHTKGDLRRKLIRRRRSCSGSFDYNDVNFQCEKSTKFEKKNKIEAVSAPLQSSNLAPLKTLTATNPGSNKWFIVVERDIILENYPFLDDMVTADPDCNLVVPHHVLTELKLHVSMSSDVRPRRTLRFLTQQIENGMAMLGEQEEGQNSSHKTILTCVKLATKDNVVILIAKYRKTLEFKPNIDCIHVFTMRDVKDILETKTTKAGTSLPRMAGIKIVIPNKFKKITCEPENSFPRELFSHYSDNNQSEKNEKLYTPPVPATKNGKIVSSIIDLPPKLSMQPVSAIISPESERKNVSLEKARSSPETNSPNRCKIADKNPHKPAMTEISSNVQEISPQSTQGKNLPISSKIDGNDPHKHASNLVPCNNNAVDEEDELSRRDSATFIAPPALNNSNLHHTSAIKTPSDRSTDEYSPTKPEFASPRKMYYSNWNCTGNKNMRDSMDASSSSTSSVSLDSINIKKIISMKKLSTATSKGRMDNAKEITPLVERPKSPWPLASYDNDNISEPSLKKTVSKNLPIEETSTSGVISNSESLNSDKIINLKKQDVRKVSRKRSVVMYEVACQSMEEVLRLRSEEWVFRFVQIMEEVLRVKLQEKIPYEQKEPAPWNLQEAARCIIKKFDRHFDVVDAANKLSRFLYESSDENGKIINIEPSDYMELYSYGVFLVETFLDMTCADCIEKDCRMEDRRNFSEEKCSCHEVVTASELLKKLLFDIHNAHVESFVDPSVDENTHYNFNMKTRPQSSTEIVKMRMGEMESANNVKRYPKRKQTHTLDEVTPKAKKPASLNSEQFTQKIDKATEADEDPRKVHKKVKAGKRYQKLFFQSLQLRKKLDNNGLSKEADVNVPPKVRKVTMGTSSGSAFFSSLQLDKKDLNNAEKLKACNITVVCSNKADAPDEQKDPRSSPEELTGLKCHFSNENNLLAISPSKVVCNFQRNEDIERKVKANWYRNGYEDSEPEEYVTGQYNETQDRIRSVDKTLGIDGMTASETETIPVDILYDRTINGNHLLMENKVHENISQDEATAIFQGYIKNLTMKLANVFARVIPLCDNYFKEKIKKPSAKSTEELQSKVKIAVSLLFRIHKSLESANQRENNYEFNLKMLLDLDNSEDYITDDRYTLQYRHVLAACAKHTNIILNAVRGDLKI